MSLNSPDAIAASDLEAQSAHPGALVIDVRPRWRYRQTHIAGSHSIPAGLLLAGEPPDGDLILIGHDSEHTRSVIDALHAQGYNRRVRYLDGGITAWKAQSSLDWELAWKQGQQLVGGPALLLVGAFTQSLGLLSLGLVILFGPVVVANRCRVRA